MIGKRVSTVAVVLIALLIMLTVSVASAKYFERQKLVEESSTCLGCHEDMRASLAGSAHQLNAEGQAVSPLAVGCIGCHDGWETHLDDPSAANISTPSSYSQMDQAEVCSRCHVTAHQTAMVSTDPHNRTEIACLSCHKIHGNFNKTLVKDDRENYCVSCHLSVMTEFRRRSAHPLESGNIRCTDCHNMGEAKDPALAVGLDWSCQRCHTDVAGPYVYEHPVAYSHLVDDGGCIECHEPHGSSNDRLLIQPEGGTCLQCHSIPAGHRTNHSGLGSKFACIDCHSGIHGSNDNRQLLDPDLGSKLFPDCYQSGCHIFNN